MESKDSLTPLGIASRYVQFNRYLAETNNYY